MKKLITLTLILLCSGCSVTLTSPYTGTSYKMGVEKERGIYLQAKPPGWDMAADLGHEIMKEATEVEDGD